MKKLIIVFAALLSALPVYAQNRIALSGVANAYDFAYGLAPNASPLRVAIGTTATGVGTITVYYGQTTAGDGTKLVPLSTHAPVTIGIGSDVETVTPSAVSCSTPQVYESCTFTATFTNTHGQGEPVGSGSFGIAEAQLFLTSNFGGGLVAVSGQLLQAAGITYTHAAVNTFITSFVSASATATVLDYSGIPTALSYQAAAGSALASTAHVIY